MLIGGGTASCLQDWLDPGYYQTVYFDHWWSEYKNEISRTLVQTVTLNKINDIISSKFADGAKTMIELGPFTYNVNKGISPSLDMWIEARDRTGALINGFNIVGQLTDSGAGSFNLQFRKESLANGISSIKLYAKGLERWHVVYQEVGEGYYAGGQDVLIPVEGPVIDETLDVEVTKSIEWVGSRR